MMAMKEKELEKRTCKWPTLRSAHFLDKGATLEDALPTLKPLNTVNLVIFLVITLKAFESLLGKITMVLVKAITTCKTRKAIT